MSALLGLSCDAFSCPRVQVAFRGYRIARGDGDRRPRRIPITISLLRQFVDLLDDSVFGHQAAAAILCVGVYGLFRSGELTPKAPSEESTYLIRSDATWTDDRVTIRLRASKTDPFRNGADIILCRNRSPTCPYDRLRAHWEAAPLQSPFAPLFQTDIGAPILYAQLHKAIKQLASASGLDPTAFSGHSLRIGGATSLAQLGYPAHFIKELGRWKSLSYQLYTRLTAHMRDAISNDLARAAVPSREGFFGGMDTNTAYRLSADDFHVRFDRPN